MKKTQTCIACGKTGLVFHRVSGGNFYLYEADSDGNPIANKRHDCKGKGSAAQPADLPPGDPNITAGEGQGKGKGQGKGQPQPSAPISAEQAEQMAKDGCTVKVSVSTGAEGLQESDDPLNEIPPTVEINEPAHENLPRLLYWLVKQREPVALFGESGSFKSTTFQMLADKLFPKAIATTPEGGKVNRKFFPMSFNSQTSKGDIRGIVDAMGQFQASPFYYAYKFGGLFLGDEFDAGNDNTNLLFNMALSNRSFTFANGETVPMHKHCYVGVGTNTNGNGADRIFTGRNEIDGATKDRFVWIIWDVNPHLELLVAGADQHEWITYVQALRKVRKDLGITSNLLTPRASIKGARALRDGQTWKDVETDLVRSTLTADEWTQLESNLPIQFRNLRTAKGCK